MANGCAFTRRVDLVNALELEKAQGQAGRIALNLQRIDQGNLDELGYLPFSQAGVAKLLHLLSKLYEHTSVPITTNLASPSGRACLGTRR